MGFWLQLRLLLWKNFALRKRQKVRLIIETIWPLFLFLILMWVRGRGLKSSIHECHFDAKALPSAGLIPFAQSLFCFFNNTCHNRVRDDSLENQLSSVNLSLFHSIKDDYLNIYEQLSSIFSEKELNNFNKTSHTISNFLKVLTNPDSPVRGRLKLSHMFNHSMLKENLMSRNIFSPEAIETLMNSEINMSLINVFFKHNFQEDGVYKFLCNKDHEIGNYIMIDEPAALSVIKFQLCLLDMFSLLEIAPILLRHLNQSNFIFQMSNIINLNTEDGISYDKLLNLQRKISTFVKNVLANDTLTDHMNELANMFHQITTSVSSKISNLNGTVQVIETLLCGKDSPGIFSKIGEFSGGAPHLNELREQLKLRRKPENFSYSYDNSTTKECNDLFFMLEGSEKTKFVFTQMKPYLRGKILFSPNNDAVDQIISEVNKTFGLIGEAKNVAVYWLNNVSPYLKKKLVVNFTVMDLIKLYLDSEILNNYPFIKEEINNLLWNRIVIGGKDRLQLLLTINKWLYFLQSDVPQYLEVADDIIHTAVTYLECFEEDRFESYDTEDEVTRRALELISENRLWAGIIFTNIKKNETSLPEYIRYKIRMDADKVDNTRRIEDRLVRPGPRRRPAIDLKYITYGFAYLQDMIEHSIIRLQTNASSIAGFYLKQFPYPCYIFDQFILAISLSFPMFMVLAWVYNSSMIIKGCVYEKEKRLKEVMKVMGLGNGVHWVGWFIESFAMMFITIILLDLILVYGKVLEHSDPIIIFLFLLCFLLATITKSFMISTFFSRANVAAAAGGIIFFLFFLPYRFMFEWQERLDVRIKIATCLISNVAFGFGCSYLAHYEEEGVGAQWHNLASSTIPDDEFSLAKCMIMMLIDSVIYCIITWYIEAVFPGMYGVPKRWYFFIQKTYWFGKNISYSEILKLDEEDALNLRDTNKDFEKEPTHLPLGVCIQNLRKLYKDKVAVDDLSLRFYEGQITSFLGHNGAGKTTTISILTGLFTPTSGTARIYQMDIRKDIDSIRRSLGMCPQHNVLFDELTVMEHLWFYARLKGLSADLVNQESEQMIFDLGLPHKRDELTKNLSGGMQRKLSVAIAFVGNSRTVILDEPTAGVDPYSRRSIWELLLKYKIDRTIILTTHHMDEADLLGDRIAIIALGKLRCCGSSLFLKSQYGDGYYLTLVKSSQWGDSPVLIPKQKKLILPNVEDEIEVDEMHADANSDTSAGSSHSGSSSSTSGYSEAINKENQVQLVTAFINSYCPGARMTEDVGSELSYLLPFGGTEKKAFERLFKSLDVNLENLKISSYGISETTLEEVFLKVAHDGIDSDSNKLCEAVEGITEGGKYPTKLRTGSLKRQDLKTKIQQAFGVNKPPPEVDVIDEMAVRVKLTSSINEIKTTSSIKLPDNFKKSIGWRLIKQQFIALHIKRFHNVRRNYKGLFSEIILPAMFVLLAMLLTLIVPPKLDGPPLELHPWLYGEPNYIFFSNEKASSNFTNSVVDSMLSPPGIGVRCMSNEPVEGKSCKPTEEDISNLIPEYNLSSIKPIPCTCSIGTPECPDGAGGPEPPSIVTGTTDTLMNTTGRNVSDWLMKTKKHYYQKRYGGFSLNEVTLPFVNATFALETILGLFNASSSSSLFRGIVESLYQTKHAQVWYNNKGWVSSMAYMNTLNNALLRSKLSSNKDPRDYGISVINHPLNFTRLQLQDELLRKGGLSLLHAICVVFALSFVPASFVLFLIEERVSNAKHLQFVSGVKPIIYWTANYFWDFCNYLVPSCLCIFIFLSFDEKAYVSADNFPGLVGLLLMYGWASIPLMYPASYIFSVPSSAFVALSSANLFIGIVTTIATFVLELFKEDQELQDIASVLRVVFLIFPHFCLGRGLIDMATNQLASDALAKFGVTMYRDPFEWNFLGRNLFSMLLQGTVYFIFVILVEYKFFCNRRELFYKSPLGDEDGDVKQERMKVLSGRENNDVLRIENLTKVYKKGNIPAVNQLCLSVKTGECFGLLGVNGAGKTSTFKMLTGDIAVTAGNAYLNGYSVLTDIDKVRQNLGYCPQFDALNSLLTGREQLTLYARLRGVPSSHIAKEVLWAIDKLGLAVHADKSACTYSGGNKRKLSTAIALIGSPPIIFLDEPTTGMDPKARRFLWNCILEILRDGRSVILTSHSMEECEALCTRLAIMVNGELKCLGSIQHLKSRFGQGYTLTIHVGGDVPSLDRLISFVNTTFCGAVLKERHHNHLQYQLPASGLTLSHLFHCLEESREQLNILDYSVSQTTLDQVFINFAKMQKDICEEEYRRNEDKYNISGIKKVNELVPSDVEYEGANKSAHIVLNTNIDETIL